MSSSPTLPNPTDRARQRDEDAQYYRHVLHKFIAMGTDLAEAAHRQAMAEPAAAPGPSDPESSTPAPTPAQAATFDRLARTVRRTIALARKLSEPVREAPGPKLRLNECPNERRTDHAETDALHAEPCERPEAPDFDADEDLDDDLDEQSLADLIASLRHDTGLATLTDAHLRQHRTPPSGMCGPCACAAGLTSAPPRITQPTQGTPRPGTGPPRP